MNEWQRIEERPSKKIRRMMHNSILSQRVRDHKTLNPKISHMNQHILCVDHREELNEERDKGYAKIVQENFNQSFEELFPPREDQIIPSPLIFDEAETNALRGSGIKVPDAGKPFCALHYV